MLIWEKYDIKKVKSIFEYAGYSEVRFGTLSIVEAKFDSQTSVIVREKIGFQVHFHQMTKVIIKNCKS